jgi:hypothetical protein
MAIADAQQSVEHDEGARARRNVSDAAERAACAQTPKRPNAQRPQPAARSTKKSAQPSTPHKARYFHTASSAEQTHLSPTGRQNATFRRACPRARPLHGFVIQHRQL